MSKKNSKLKRSSMTKVSFRVNSDILKRIKGRLSENGLSLSEYVRFCVVANAEYHPGIVFSLDSEDRKLLQRLVYLTFKSSTNLNQIAHSLNEFSGLSFLDTKHDDLVAAIDSADMDLNEAAFRFSGVQDDLHDIFHKLYK